jgi:pimeloyl-ACP methyl ester carboxylesterase
MRERVFTFGTNDILMGVLTEPSVEVARPGAPAIVVTNVGLNPRIGPQRVWVELARSLAQLGLTTLRFDLNGMGDSLPRRDARDDLTRAAVDLGEALDFLQKRRGYSRFVLIGLCSGVDSAHRVATVDPRVAAAVFLDGYTYDTPRSRFTRIIGRHLSIAGVRRAIARRLVRLGGEEVGEADEIYVRDYPSRAHLASDLEQMLARGVRLLFIYSGSRKLTFSYREQFFEMLRPARFEGRIDVELRRQADHTYVIPSERRIMIERVGDWILRQLEASEASDEADESEAPGGTGRSTGAGASATGG